MHRNDRQPRKLRTNWPREARIREAIPATVPIKRECNVAALSPTALGLVEGALQELVGIALARGEGATRDELARLWECAVLCRVAGHPVRMVRRAQGRVATARARD